VSYLEQWLDPDASANYDSIIYDKATYDSFIWELQRPRLRELAATLRTRDTHLRYLDFACGTGRVTAALADIADEALGMDLSPAMADRARQRAGCPVVVGDITNPDERPPGQFNLITAFRFFLNAPAESRSEVLNALSTLLTPDGLLVFNIHGNKWSTAALVRLSRDASRSQNLMSLGEVRRMARSAGLRVVAHSGYGLWPRQWYYGRFAPHLKAVDRRVGGGGLSRYSHDIVFVCAKG
jgi:SAM-dependent methyltransferase